MTENIHGPYADAIAHLKDVADGGSARRESEKRSVDNLLSLSHHAPKQQPKYGDALTHEMMKSVDR